MTQSSQRSAEHYSRYNYSNSIYGENRYRSNHPRSTTRQKDEYLPVKERYSARRSESFSRNGSSGRSFSRNSFSTKAVASVLLTLAIVSGCLLAPWQNALAAFGIQIPGWGDVGTVTVLEAPIGLYPVSVDDLEDTHYLALVNSSYPLHDESHIVQTTGTPTACERLVAADTMIPACSHDILLDQQALSAVCELIEAAHAAGMSDFGVVSGYRNYSQQAEIYYNTADRSYVQPPGMSEHQTGFAVDLAVFSKASSGVTDDESWQWLAENAWRFGLILRYAGDKQSITGIASEPWHFRYVGKPHAWYCWHYDLCLEEYIQMLQTTGGYRVTLSGRGYSVLYQIPIDGMINLPEKASDNVGVSSDNTGGLIITTE